MIRCRCKALVSRRPPFYLQITPLDCVSCAFLLTYLLDVRAWHSEIPEISLKGRDGTLVIETVASLLR